MPRNSRWSTQLGRWSRLATVFAGAALVAIAATGCDGGKAQDNIGLERYQTAFDSADELKNWKCLDDGKWKIEKGWLVVDSRIEGNRSILWLDRKFVNDVKIKFDAECIEKPGDLNSFLCGNGKDYSGYEIIVGGWTNERLAITRSREDGNGEARKRLGFVPIELEKDRVYSIMVKKYRGTIKVYVDDQLMITETDKEPLRSTDYRYFGFSSFANVVKFDNLTIEKEE